MNAYELNRDNTAIRWLAMCLALLLLCAAQNVCAAQPNLASILVNPGFETDPVQAGWEVTVYGAKPALNRDSAVHKQGASSLRISSDSPSDTAIDQEIVLRPGKWYRLRGWVMTHDLDPRGASVCGTLQVQRPGGAGVLAGGVSHSGDTAWTEVTVPFCAPEDGRVRICIFYVGFGKGTGTAWFDGLSLEEVNLSMSAIKVTRDRLHAEPINPFQYGQFIEHLCTLVPGMWAEKLYDGSFEGLSPYKLVYLKETDFKEKPWYPSGATNRGHFDLDSETRISGKVSKRITALSGAPCTLGIAQDGVAVQKGLPCTFSCYMKRTGFKGPVHVSLHHDGRVVASADLQPGEAWSKLKAALLPSETENSATLSIEFRGPGVLWLDNASLMPDDNVGGWRADVVEAVKALKPGIIRYGGSTLDDANLGDFKWRDAVGDPDTRMPFTAWGGLQPAAAGLEEIVQFCYLVDAEPLICIRFEHNTPEEAAAEVEYFNGDASTPMGALRAKNGHTKPYGVRYWQVGNERSGSQYESGLAGFCKAMRTVDANIKILSSYPTPDVLEKAGSLLDYVSPHQYSIGDMSGTAAQLDSVRRMIAQYGGGKPIKVGVTEWNTTAGNAGPERAMLWDLENALACSRYQNLIHRNCDLVQIANRSNLTNSFCSGIIQTDNHRLYKTPTYYAQQLYSTLAGTQSLKIESDLPVNFAPDLSATLSSDGKLLTLFAVNSTGEEIKRPFDLSDFGYSEAEVWTLADGKHAGEPDVTNGFEYPDRVIPVTSRLPLSGAKFEMKFPPYSLTVLRFHISS